MPHRTKLQESLDDVVAPGHGNAGDVYLRCHEAVGLGAATPETSDFVLRHWPRGWSKFSEDEREKFGWLIDRLVALPEAAGTGTIVARVDDGDLLASAYRRCLKGTPRLAADCAGRMAAILKSEMDVRFASKDREYSVWLMNLARAYGELGADFHHLAERKSLESVDAVPDGARDVLASGYRRRIAIILGGGNTHANLSRAVRAAWEYRERAGGPVSAAYLFFLRRYEALSHRRGDPKLRPSERSRGAYGSMGTKGGEGK